MSKVAPFKMPAPAAEVAAWVDGSTLPAEGALIHLPLDAIDLDPAQPRRGTESENLTALAESIKQSGVIQPVVVEALLNGRFLLVVGERRVRAVKLAGLPTVPAVVRRSIDERERRELQLLENLQRKDLLPIDKAHALVALKQSGMKDDEIGQRLGMSRVSVAESRSLVSLPVDIQAKCRTFDIPEGVLRELAKVKSPDEQRRLFTKAAHHGMTVEQVKAARERIEGKAPKRPPANRQHFGTASGASFAIKWPAELSTKEARIQALKEAIETLERE